MALLDRPPLVLQPAPALELLALPEPRFKRAQLVLHFDRPLDDGRAPARSLLAEVLEQGTRRHPNQMELSRAEEDLYAASVSLDSDRQADAHRLRLALSWVGERFLPPGAQVADGSLRLGRELLEEPCRGAGGAPFPDATLARERAQLARRIRSLPDERDAYARERFLALLCPDEPYGTPPWGSAEAIEGLDGAALEAARRDLLEHAAVSAVLVGPVDPEPVAALLADWFGAGGSLAGAPREALSAPSFRLPARLREECERLELDQARFRLGFRFVPPREPLACEAHALASSILGGGVHGRLFRIVREERSLCYGIGSTLRTRKGILGVSAGIDAGSYEAVRDEVMRQVAILAAGGWTEDEERAARANHLNRLDALADAPGALAWFFERERLLGFRRTPAGRAADLARVGRDDIAAAAASWQPSLVYLLAGAAAAAEVVS